MTQPQLPGTVTVHCFFAGTCDHQVVDTDPDRAHRQMEDHYGARHRADIARVLGGNHPTDTPRR